MYHDQNTKIQLVRTGLQAQGSHHDRVPAGVRAVWIRPRSLQWYRGKSRFSGHVWPSFAWPRGYHCCDLQPWVLHGMYPELHLLREDGSAPSDVDRDGLYHCRYPMHAFEHVLIKLDWRGFTNLRILRTAHHGRSIHHWHWDRHRNFHRAHVPKRTL
jgi:hypothetical protein